MKNNNSTANLSPLSWIRSNFLFLLAGFLLVFIPLYPKLPLFDAIPGYIVRVRLEDFFILLAVGIWLIQLVRQKVTLHPLFTKIILLYAVIGFLSTLSALFLTKTVPLSPIHVAKLYFHYFRRLEYFSLFFVVFSALKTKKQAKILLVSAVVTLILVALYGFGQKYLYWPVYSTMNREFAKGWRLYLTEHARVPSTFGGHYDAAAFTMLALTVSVSLMLISKKIWLRLTALIAFVMGYYLLILTASRTSFIAFLFAVNIVFAFNILLLRQWRQIAHWFVVMLFCLITAFFFGDLFDRFQQVPFIASAVSWRDSYEFKLPRLKPEIDLPENYVSTDELAMITSKSDMPPVPYKPGSKADPKSNPDLPPDVYEDIPLPVPVLDEQGNETGEYMLQQRQYSDAAHTYGLSAAIRYDTLWPRAFAGFKRNPLLGSGYATLTKEEVGQFTEAESTDNEFLRVLGETGILGFTSFFASVVVATFIAFQAARKETDVVLRAFLIGFIGASFGLLLNAAYIDVFTASKVAESYWMLTGIALAISAITLNSPSLTLAQFFSRVKPSPTNKKTH